jgi:hypothetical protein
MPVEVRIKVRGIEQAEHALEKIPGGARVAISRAINDGLRKARTEIKKAIGAVYNLKSGVILAGLKREFPAYASPGSLFGLLHIESYKFPVADFEAVDLNPAGVRFEEIRGRYSGLPHAFMAGMKSGHSGVFGRIDGTARLRIREITGLSIPQMLENPKVEPKWQKIVEDEVEQRLDHYVSYLLASK